VKYAVEEKGEGFTHELTTQPLMTSFRITLTRKGSQWTKEHQGKTACILEIDDDGYAVISTESKTFELDILDLGDLYTCLKSYEKLYPKQGWFSKIRLWKGSWVR
jgi:hypothetical protein